MLVPTDKVEKWGEGTGLRTNTKDRWKDTQPLSATGSVPAGERIHRDRSSAKTWRRRGLPGLLVGLKEPTCMMRSPETNHSRKLFLSDSSGTQACRAPPPHSFTLPPLRWVHDCSLVCHYHYSSYCYYFYPHHHHRQTSIEPSSCAKGFTCVVSFNHIYLMNWSYRYANITDEEVETWGHLKTKFAQLISGKAVIWSQAVWFLDHSSSLQCTANYWEIEDKEGSKWRVVTHNET